MTETMTSAMPGRAAEAPAAAVARASRRGAPYRSEPFPIGSRSSTSTSRQSEKAGSGTLSRGQPPQPTLAPGGTFPHNGPPIDVGTRVAAMPPPVGSFGSGRNKAMRFFARATE
jgi:hypothetical protein